MKIKQKAKESLVKAFGVLLTQKEFSTITVREVAAEAKVTRQIFYYYFDNMIELLKEYTDFEMLTILKEERRIKSLEDGYILYFKILSSKKNLILNLKDAESVGVLRLSLEFMARKLFERFLRDVFRGYKLHPSDEDFLLNHYKTTLASFAFEWIENGMESDVVSIIGNISILINQSLVYTLQKFEEKYKR